MTATARPDTIDWGVDFSSFAASLTAERGTFAPVSRPMSSLHRRNRTSSYASSFSNSFSKRPQTAISTTRQNNHRYNDEDFGSALDHGDNVRVRRSQNDVAALVDFLKNHAPPPDNFMSIPYDMDEEDRGRWADKIKKIAKRRSKSVPRVPHIRLPDSAVSGTTTGGHRHIAISIPVEASPCGEMSRSQYPVYPNTDVKSNPSLRSNPIRTYTNEKGVVTVLRPVTETFEASATEAVPRPPRINIEQFHKPLPSKPLPTPPLSASSTSSNRDTDKKRSHEYIGVRPDRFDTPILSQNGHSQYWSQQQQGSVNARSKDAFQRSTYPTRGSSMAASRSSKNHHPVSIDDLIASNEGYYGGSPVSNSEAFSDDASEHGNSTAMDGISRMRHSKSASRLLSDRKSELRQSGDVVPRVTVISDNPLASRLDDSRPSTRGSTRSRRDMVREKKRKDLEAARQRKYSPDSSTGPEDNRDSGAELNVVGRPSNDSVTKRSVQAPQKNVTKEAEEISRPTLCPIMVVMDIEPNFSDDGNGNVERPRTPVSAENDVHEITAKVTDVTESSARVVSDEGSPLRKPRSMDRTSLTRRREWNAHREQERQKRESTAAARAKAKQLLASGMSYERVRESQANEEIVRLFEAFREHRFRDMERRLRRLERNGDVWLQALLPMLEEMKQTFTSMQDNSFRSLRDWASDGEDTTVTKGRRSRSLERAKLPRRASVSDERVVEKMVQRVEKTNAWADGEAKSGDMTGLGAIEPLMRELSSEPKRESIQRQLLAAQSLGLSNECLLQVLQSQQMKPSSKTLM